MNDATGMTRRDLMRIAGAAALGGGMSHAAWAQSQVSGAETILSVTPGSDRAPVHFSDADLMALPQQRFDTSTIWTGGVQTFSGPSLSDVLAAAQGVARPETLRLQALNDYIVHMDVAVVEDTVPILANRIDGAPFGVRDKGPLWIVFPYDSNERFRSEVIYTLSVWQLRRIDVVG
ncbi:hypothetical protein [Nioella nitratireducens]|uniref:hypothetical protein n=1 Tax=Nioella nitratireducens TaxID=1287720 RepID=UPI0008FD3C05|nr:hypothetical protein [Nioella nitratireducens]